MTDSMLKKQGWSKNIPYLAQCSHHTLLNKIIKMRQQGITIYPTQDEIFKAFELVSFDEVRAIIVGQDPYHGQGQALGLAFSVREGVSTPPSLRNIFKEIANDCDLDNSHSINAGSVNLERWAKQGILLINAILTVEDGKPLSHKDLGWQELTYAVLEALGQREKPLAVLLWGNAAKKFVPLFMKNGHLILTASHPSPLSAHRGFLGCKHFSMLNAWLTTQHLPNIAW